MRRGARLPDDQVEVVFGDIFVEQLDVLTAAECTSVLAEVVGLCQEPSGKHPLHRPLAGWNTLDVLAGHKRVVYKASIVGGVGLIEVLCMGPRRESEVYDMATGVANSGQLTEDEVAQLWTALALLDVAPVSVGLGGWDYRPAPAPDGLRRAAVAAGLLTEADAAALSKDEIEAAMKDGWGPSGADPEKALEAAVRRARGKNMPPVNPRTMIKRRLKERCNVPMPRAATRCVRQAGHPGPHRAS